MLEKFKNLLPHKWLIIGITLFVFAHVLNIQPQNSYAFDLPTDVEISNDFTSDEEIPNTLYAPTQINIPSIDVNLNIKTTTIDAGVWQVPDDAVGHLDKSAKPGEGSNIVMYAHNRRGLFINLPNLSMGDEIEIVTEDGATHTYVIKTMQIVSPEEIHIVLPTETETLTLYTCHGLFDRYRFVVQAIPQ